MQQQTQTYQLYQLQQHKQQSQSTKKSKVNVKQIYALPQLPQFLNRNQNNELLVKQEQQQKNLEAILQRLENTEKDIKDAARSINVIDENTNKRLDKLIDVLENQLQYFLKKNFQESQKSTDISFNLLKKDLVGVQDSVKSVTNEVVKKVSDRTKAMERNSKQSADDLRTLYNESIKNSTQSQSPSQANFSQQSQTQDDSFSQFIGLFLLGVAIGGVLGAYFTAS